MKSRVFVSCGQHTDAEKHTADVICRRLRKRGFDPYLAIQAQTIADINGGIIGELKNSDYYLFINFRREPLPRGRSKAAPEFRGSLFSNQEFAIAYALDFEKFLIVNQAGVRQEGMLRYIGLNTKPFTDHSDCLATVAEAIKLAGWKSDYSRRFRADGLVFRPTTYSTHMGQVLHGEFLYLDIHNARPDIAAMETTARLVEYGAKGKALRRCHISSPLKASGRPGFAHAIFPRSHEAFDLLCVGSLCRVVPSISSVAASGTASIGSTVNLLVEGTGGLSQQRTGWTLETSPDDGWCLDIALRVSGSRFPASERHYGNRRARRSKSHSHVVSQEAI